MNMTTIRKQASFPVKADFLEELQRLARMLKERGIEPVSLSYRYGLGFATTRQGTDLKRLSEKDLLWIEQINFDAGTFILSGMGEPQRSAFLHAAVFRHRSAAIFAVTVRVNGGDISRPKVSSSETAWLDQVRVALNSGNAFTVDDTEVLSFGCTVDDAAAEIRDPQERLA